MAGRLAGKTAVITGAGRGIGRAVALGFAGEGAKVVVNDLGTATTGGEGHDTRPAQTVVEEIKAAGGTAVADYGDVGSFKDAEKLINKAIDAWGKLDILVNVAGNQRLCTIVDITEDDFDSVVRVHLRGTFNTSHFAAQHWVKRKEYGRLINFSSGAGFSGIPVCLSYAAAKAGIVGLTRSCANLLVPYNVTANVITPGAQSRMADYTDGQRAQEEFKKTGKWPSDSAMETDRDPRHVTPLIVWLASPQASHISGRVFGGRHGHYSLWSERAEERVVTKNFLEDEEALYAELPELGAGLRLEDLPSPVAPLAPDWRKDGVNYPRWDFKTRL